ncbi:DUF7509 family protein [Natronoarchaeum rubrum]|uniref:DUF7509 family protein n=1 Tax=Natronoarchaeum rubrum TaxID=755311 RepID=UPI0021125B86|nr:hypothetical protein [Natronoarchaeum rubrum]
MRDRIVSELGDLPYGRFLVYVMGPYQAFDPDVLRETTDPESVPASIDFGTLVDAEPEMDRDEAALDLLLEVRDSLRTDVGVNAFLAIDIDVPLEEMDAATQSVAFSKASNAVVYVVPRVGDNLGVGIEVGSVLEALFTDGPGDHRERVVFAHESGVRSAMIAAVRDRWDARVVSYEDRDELVERVQLFVRDIARKELRGDLGRLDE